MDPVTSFLCLCDGQSMAVTPSPSLSSISSSISASPCLEPRSRAEYRSELSQWYCLQTCHNRSQEDCLTDQLASIVCQCRGRGRRSSLLQER